MMGQIKAKQQAVGIVFCSIAFLVIYESLHLIDHILQYVQKYALGMSSPPALFEGLLNASDTTVHLWLNVIEYVAIIVLWFAFKQAILNETIKTRLSQTKRKHLIIATVAILFLLVFQTLHVIDHIFQYVQLYELGIENPPALFEGAFNESDTVIHLWINGTLILGIFVVWASLNALQRWKIVKPVVFIDEKSMNAQETAKTIV